MDTYSIKKQGYDPESAVDDGNRFLIANGYMGYRGTLEEAGSGSYAAVNLAGVYDQNGDRWREPVNAPNGLFAALNFNGKALSLPGVTPKDHFLSIDYRHGIFERYTDFGEVSLKTERIASLSSPHLLAEKITLNFEKAGKASLTTGISTDIWDINGPHFKDIKCSHEKALLCNALTGEKEILVSVAQEVKSDRGFKETIEERSDGIFRILDFEVKAGEKAEFFLFATVYTSLDLKDPSEAAAALCEESAERGFDLCKKENNTAWDRVLESCSVDIEGCDEAALYMHASLDYLNSIAPRHADNLSIPARGLSGQTYKGAVFWDSEIFLFPMFVYTQPEIARSLLRYRADTLKGALEKAASYGYRGAFYAWESQEGGIEGCTNFNVVDVFTHRPVRTYFRDKQIHISADIAYAMQKYYDITGDRSLLKEGGAEVILQCARFYLSRANAHADSQKIDFADVIGPDEYHERVTNNAFTNRMVLFCIESALGLSKVFKDSQDYLEDLYDRLDYRKDLELLSDLAKRLEKYKEKEGIIEQFDGYFDLEDASLKEVKSKLCNDREYWGGDHGVAGTTRIIKQADVIALMALFPEEFSKDCVKANWDYYEPRTEHGSSLSACMYALTACRIGEPDRAWDFFMKSASIDVKGGGKQWAGEIYIGGTHPASNGGAWMIAVLGFAGLTIKNGRPELNPNLPKQIKRMRFPIYFGGKRLVCDVTREAWSIN